MVHNIAVRAALGLGLWCITTAPAFLAIQIIYLATGWHPGLGDAAAGWWGVVCLALAWLYPIRREARDCNEPHMLYAWGPVNPDK